MQPTPSMAGRRALATATIRPSLCGLGWAVLPRQRVARWSRETLEILDRGVVEETLTRRQIAFTMALSGICDLIATGDNLGVPLLYGMYRRWEELDDEGRERLVPVDPELEGLEEDKA